MAMLTRTALALSATLVVTLSGGCALHRPASGGDSATSTISVTADQYTTTFNAARSVLRDRGFILERVDAAAGIITTQPKTTGGLATPWDREQQSLEQEIEDALQRQQRIVRIVFEPETGGAPAAPVAASEGAEADALPAPDLRAAGAPLRMSVHVTLQRINVPHRRLEADAIGQSTYTWDPALAARGMQPTYAVSIREDRPVADRIASLIREQAAVAKVP